MPVFRAHNQMRDALARYPLIKRVFELSAERAVPAYLVGGTVRDFLLGQDTHDLDFAVQGSGLALARYIADQLDGYFVPLDRKRRTGRVILAEADPSTPQSLDIASLRGEDLQSDLEGRDFTLNAIAIAPTEDGWRIQDPLGGRQDLSQGILRLASPSGFEDDPVRTLRAVRLQVQFGFAIEPRTHRRLQAAVPLLEDVSAERVRDEWFKILQLADAAVALGELSELGLLKVITPEIARSEHLDHALATVGATERLWATLNAPADQPQTDRERRLLESLEHLEPHLRRRYSTHICDERSYLVLLKCAALLHAPSVDGFAFAVRWKLSKREGQLLHTAIQHYAEVQALAKRRELNRRSIYCFFEQTGEPGIDAAMLSLAHTMAVTQEDQHEEGLHEHTKAVAQLLEAWFEHHDTQIAPTPLLSGKEVMRALDQQAGPQIGELLQALIQEQAAGEILTRQQALAFLQGWKMRNGAKEAKHACAKKPD